LIGVDTNILVHAYRDDATWHQTAYAAMRSLAEGRDPWVIPWPCVHEFIAVVTHHRVFKQPSPIGHVFAQIDAWVASPSLRLIAEPAGYLDALRQVAEAGRVTGPKIHDARVAAICLQHGVSEFWTADRDFSRFPALKTRNPLVA
jgi:toxin-antitoxin system PIN domain toxin